MALSPDPSFALRRWLRPCAVLLAASLFLTTCNRDVAGPSVPTQLVFTVQPSTQTAGRFIKPAVQVAAEDASGQIVLAFTGDITVTVMTDTGATATTATVAAVDGVARFDALWIRASGTHYILAAVANGLQGATSIPFDITPGPPTHLGFIVQPTTTTAGAPITPAVQVAALDAMGNTTPLFAGALTVAIGGSNPGGATLAGTTTVTAVNGVATFVGLSIDKSRSYWLTATATGLSGTTSEDFTIAPGPPSRLEFTAQPTTTTAGRQISPAVKVRALDALGNDVPAFTDTVTVALGVNPTGDTLSGAAVVPAEAGLATFYGLSLRKSGTGYTLAAAATGLAGATSAPFDITPGAATHLGFVVQPSPPTAGTVMTPAVQVAALDASGNTVPSVTTDVTVALVGNSGNGALAGTTTVTTVGGLATYTTLSVDKSGAGYALTATASGLGKSTSTEFTVAAGPATQLAFTVEPPNAVAGAPLAPAVQVSARDAFGNLAPTFTDSVTVAITAGTGTSTAVLSGTRTVAAAGGVASFATLSIGKNGVDYTLLATAPGLTGATSAVFDVDAGPATQLVFSVQPSSALAARTISPAVRVTALDAFGNPGASFTGTVTVALGTNPGGGTLSGTTAVAASSGVATFSTLKIDKVGTGYTLTATAPSLSGATSSAFDITPGPAKQLIFTAQPTTTTAGAAIAPAVQVTALDVGGNVSGFSGTVAVALGANPTGGTLSGTTTLSAVNGVATLSTLQVDKAGSGYTLTAVAPFQSTITGTTSAPFDITAGPAAQLAFTVQPTTAAAGANLAPAVQVAARDALGNAVTSFIGTVTVAITPGTGAGGAALSGTRTVAALGGVATFSTLSLDKSGAGYKLSATTPGLTEATSAPFTVTAASAAHLVFTAHPRTTTANAVIAPAVQVTAQDALGNAVPEFTDAVTVAITAGTGPGGATLAGTTTVTAVGGVATFANLSLDKAGATARGTAYTLSAAAPGLAAATSDPFDIVPGPATRLAFTIQPASTRSGTYVAPPVQVTALDAAGNVVSGFTGTVTAAIGTNPAGGTLSGTTTVAAVAGVATFSALRIDKVGTGYTFVATAPGLAAATSAAFDITPGAGAQLEFTTQPGTATAGATIAPAVRVLVRDALGNVATGFTGNVTVAIGTNPGSGTLTGTRTLAASAGIATFSTLSIDQAGSGYTLTAVAAGLTGTVSAPFDVIPSTAAQLVFTVQPSTATAGTTLAPAVEVKARDALGNLVPSFSGSVTLAIGTNPAGGSLSGTSTVTAVSGTATFSTLSIDRSGSDYSLTASSPGVAGATSAPFNVTAAPATHLVFTVQPSTATAGATITPQVEVTALDGLGNTATGFSGNVTLAIGNNPGGGSLSGTATVAAVAGVASFTNLSIDKAASGYTLSATAVGATPAVSNAFDVTAAPATHLAFVVQPSGATAGATISPAVQLVAQDALGNTETGFTGTVTLTITAGTGTSGARLSGTTPVTAVAGVATFGGLSIDKAGGGYTLSATAAGLAGSTSASFSITPGAATQLVLTVQPSTVAAGAAITPAVRVAARDGLGNTATGFTGSVTIAIGANPGGGALSGTTSVAAVAGIATFSNLSIDRAASGYTLTATAAGVTGAVSAPFDVAPGAATHLVFTLQPSTTTAGLSITPAVEVTAQDPLGNVVPGFTGNVTVAIAANPAGGILSGTTTVAAVAGGATFSDFTIDKSGSGYTLSATASGLAGAISSAFAITPGPATNLVFTVPPTTAAANGIIKPAVRVTARDALGNTVTGFVGNVTVAIGTNPAGGALSGTRTFAAIAGVASFPTLRIDTPGSGYTLTAGTTGLAGATSAPFDITPSVATHLVVSAEPADSQTAGVTIAPTVQVEAKDASGTLVPTFTGDVTAAIAPGTGVPGALLSGSTTVAAVGGVATFANLSIDRSEAWYTLSFTAAGVAEPTLNSFRVFPGAATTLAFAVQPSTATAGATITPQIEVIARDALGNTATGFNGSVTIAIGNNPGGGSLSGTTTVAAVAGIAVFRGLSIAQAGSGYTLVVTASGLADAMSLPFDITAERASHLIFTTQPTSTTAGEAISPAVEVTVHDASGHTATGFTGNVTLTITARTGATGATLSGTTTVAAVNGVAIFSGLSIDRAGSGYTLSATAPGVAGTTSSFFAVNAGAPTQLTFTPRRIPADSSASQPAAGATITPAIPVAARDALENTVESFTGNVTVAISTNPGGGTLSGTTTVAALAGVATFNDLSIDRSGVGYQLEATASGLSPGSSTGFVITPAAATQLVFSVQPSAADAGTSMSPAVRITVFDALGNVATQFTGDVTLAIRGGTGTAGAVLVGTTTVAALNGVAIFSGLSIDRAGSGYTLSATAAGLSGATSTPFDIN